MPGNSRIQAADAHWHLAAIDWKRWEISVDRTAYSSAALTLVLAMQNPNAFAVQIDGLAYAVRIGNLELAKGVARHEAVDAHLNHESDP